jgi:3-dehydroquinate synthase
MNLGEDSYDIVVERGALAKANQYLNLNRRVLVVTDSGVPQTYAETLASLCREAVICTVEQGESSKSLDGFGKLIATMLDHGFSRKDCVVAVGGGVVGDLSGFAASAYMRGIDFYNIPTTLLSQIDSSIGGKTAINFGGVKNVVGAFYQPKKVLVDPDLLHTLPPRQMANGLSEAIKMALTSDKELFDIFENKDAEENIDEIIVRSLNIKKNVVEADEKEAGLRKILNFGHTVGHGIESSEGMSELYHGECVALGMMFMANGEAKKRIEKLLNKNNLPSETNFNVEAVYEALHHDKKSAGSGVNVVKVKNIGEFQFEFLEYNEIYKILKGEK